MDVPGAKRELAEAERAARKVHNTLSLAEIRWQFATLEAEKGRYGEAARILEEAASEVAGHGSTGYAADAYFCVAMFHLAAGDWEGYRRVSAALLSGRFARILEDPVDRPGMIRPLDALLRGDLVSFEEGFAGILREADAVPAQAVYRGTMLWQHHFYYGVALRALGREAEAEAHLRQALELLRALNYPRDFRLAESDYGTRIAETIRRRMRAA